MKWIAVQDRLPPPGEEVLVYLPVIFEVSFHTGEEWDCMDEPTHWMQLEPPAEDTCNHDLIDPSNDIISGNGYKVCRQCGKVFRPEYYGIPKGSDE